MTRALSQGLKAASAVAFLCYSFGTVTAFNFLSGKTVRDLAPTATEYRCADRGNLTCCPLATCGTIQDDASLTTCLKSIGQSCLIDATATWELNATESADFLCIDADGTNLNMYFDQFGDYTYALRASISGLPSNCTLESALYGEIPQLNDTCAPMDGVKGDDLFFYLHNGVLEMRFNETSGVSSVLSDCGSWDDVSLSMTVVGISRHPGKVFDQPPTLTMECVDPTDDLCCPDSCLNTNGKFPSTCLSVLPSSCEVRQAAEWVVNDKITDYVCTEVNSQQINILFTEWADFVPSEASISGIPSSCTLIGAYAGMDVQVDSTGPCVSTTKLDITDFASLEGSVLTVTGGHVARSTGVTVVFDTAGCSITSEMFRDLTLSGVTTITGQSTTTTTASTTPEITATVTDPIATTDSAMTQVGAVGAVGAFVMMLAISDSM